MDIPFLVTVTAIPGPQDTVDTLTKAARLAVHEALRIHWKADLQHHTGDTFVLGAFKVSIMPSAETPAPSPEGNSPLIRRFTSPQ